MDLPQRETLRVRYAGPSSRGRAGERASGRPLQCDLKAMSMKVPEAARAALIAAALFCGCVVTARTGAAQTLAAQTLAAQTVAAQSGAANGRDEFRHHLQVAQETQGTHRHPAIPVILLAPVRRDGQQRSDGVGGMERGERSDGPVVILTGLLFERLEQTRF